MDTCGHVVFTFSQSGRFSKPTVTKPRCSTNCEGTLPSHGFRPSLCFSWQTSESRVNFVVLRQPGVQLLDPGEDGSTSNNSSSSSSNGGSPVHHRRRLDQNHYRRKSTYQKVSFVNNSKSTGYSWTVGLLF